MSLLDRIYADEQITHRRQLLHAALTGWSFGFGYFVAGLWWLGNAVLVEGEASTFLMLPLAVLGLPAFLALYWGLAALLQALICREGYGRVIALAAAFGVAEWLRGWLFTGFPWNAIGYSAMPTPLLMQIATLTGLEGVNALAVLLYATPVMLVTRGNRGGRIISLVVAFCLIALIVLFGALRLHGLPTTEILADAPGVRARLVQPSIAQSDKQDHLRVRENFDRHLHLTGAPPLQDTPIPDIIVWPETAVPYILAQVPEAVEAIAGSLQPGQLALVGTVRADAYLAAAPAYYNALEVIDAQGTVTGHADKVHLVPFGEYWPAEQLFAKFGLGAIAAVAGGYSAGKNHRSIRLNDNITILPLICYEAIFPNELDHEGEAADVVVNISNDAWYGITSGPFQHFHQARLRTVETGKPMIRVANNGISAIIDPYGRIVAQLNLNEVGFVDATIPSAIEPIWGKSKRGLFVLCLFLILFTISCAVKYFRKFE